MNIFETSYTEYLRAKKSGLRREAMTALNTFLAACGNVDTASKRQIVKDFFTRQSAKDIENACSFPLNSQLLFPVLAEWCAENPGVPFSVTARTVTKINYCEIRFGKVSESKYRYSMNKSAASPA